MNNNNDEAPSTKSRMTDKLSRNQGGVTRPNKEEQDHYHNLCIQSLHFMLSQELFSDHQHLGHIDMRPIQGLYHDKDSTCEVDRCSKEIGECTITKIKAHQPPAGAIQDTLLHKINDANNILTAEVLNWDRNFC